MLVTLNVTVVSVYLMHSLVLCVLCKRLNINKQENKQCFHFFIELIATYMKLPFSAQTSYHYDKIK